MRRQLAWGGLLGALLVSVAAAYGATGLPVLPVYDGVQPPTPYRWVDPPPEFAEQNQLPDSGSQLIPSEDVALGFGAATDDAQAQLIVAGEVAAEPPPDSRQLRVVITPLDPDTVGPPPAGLVFAGNAYEFEAAYTPGGEPLELTRAATLVERYATRAGVLLRWTGSGWERLPNTQIVRGSLQVFAEVIELGTFVAAGPPPHTAGSSPLPWIGAAAGGAVLAAGVSWILLRRSRKQRDAKRGKKKSGKKK